MKINDKINNWVIIKGPFIVNGKNKFTCKCKCGKEYDYFESYIRRSNFSKSCRSCSGKERWKENAKYVVGYKIKNLTIIKNAGLQKNGNTLFKVRCDCGHEYHTGHTTIVRKHSEKALPYCNNCFLSKYKKPKRNTMLTEHMSLSHYHKLMRNAKLRGIEFNLSADYLEDLFIKQDKRCYYTNIKIKMSKNFHKKDSRKEHTASLDRIDSNLPYVEDNVVWVHKDINFMKGSLTHNQFLEYCKLIHFKHGNPEPSSTGV